MSTKTILWPTDAFTPSAELLPAVREKILRESASVHLVYLTEDLTDFEKYWGSGPNAKHAESLRDFAERQAKERLNDFCSCELQGCQDYQVHFAFGDVADQIVRLVDELGVDEIMVAKRPGDKSDTFASGVEGALSRLNLPVTAIDVAPSKSRQACDDPEA